MEVIYLILILLPKAIATACFMNCCIYFGYRAIYVNGCSCFFNGKVCPEFLIRSTILTNDKIRTTRMIKPIIQPNTITQTLFIPSILQDLILKVLKNAFYYKLAFLFNIHSLHRHKFNPFSSGNLYTIT